MCVCVVYIYIYKSVCVCVSVCMYVRMYVRYIYIYIDNMYIFGLPYPLGPSAHVGEVGPTTSLPSACLSGGEAQDAAAPTAREFAGHDLLPEQGGIGLVLRIPSKYLVSSSTFVLVLGIC